MYVHTSSGVVHVEVDLHFDGVQRGRGHVQQPTHTCLVGGCGGGMEEELYRCNSRTALTASWAVAVLRAY